MIGCLAWRWASADGADPYDSGTYWEAALVTAAVAGALANTAWAALVTPPALIAYPFYNTPQLAEEAGSPFGGIGVFFLVVYMPVLAGAGWLGAYLRRSWDETRARRPR